MICYPPVMPKSMKAAGGGPGSHGSGMDVPHFVFHVVALLREACASLCGTHWHCLSLWTCQVRSDNCKWIIFLCSQIDEDKRRDTTQRLRQGKYDKKVTCLQCPCSLSQLRRTLSGRRSFLTRDNFISPDFAKWLDLLKAISHLFSIRCFALCLLVGGKILETEGPEIWYILILRRLTD